MQCYVYPSCSTILFLFVYFASVVFVYFASLSPSSTKVHSIHFIYQSPSHSFHLPKSIPFISSTNIPLIHFIYHNPSLSYLPYLVILILHCHLVLFSRYIKKHDFCLNIFIHELISTLMHQNLISQR